MPAKRSGPAVTFKPTVAARPTPGFENFKSRKPGTGKHGDKQSRFFPQHKENRADGQKSTTKKNEKEPPDPYARGRCGFSAQLLLEILRAI